MSRTQRRANILATTDTDRMPRPRRASMARRARRTATRQAYIAAHLADRI